MILVPVGLGAAAADEEDWLSFPQKMDDEDCGEGVECGKRPPHAGVEWPEEFECVCCCCCCCCCGFGSFWNDR